MTANSSLGPTIELFSTATLDESNERACEKPNGTQLPTEARYTSPPPSYPCIQGTAAARRGVTNNLMTSFVRMKLAENSLISPKNALYMKGLDDRSDASGEKHIEVEMGKVYDVRDAFLWGLEEDIQLTERSVL